MLLDEQAAELLRRCELITGQQLEIVRGNLRNASTRAAAVWELLVLEEASRIGKVEYEPVADCIPGSRPDILLTLMNERKIWIEVAFLYPRFWKQERQSRTVDEWIREEAKKRGVCSFKISTRFNGDSNNPAGPTRKLPELQKRKSFLIDPEVACFFDSIKKDASQGRSIKLSKYSVELIYTPQDTGPFHHSGGGLVQEVPKIVKEHAVYRVLKQKARQHRNVQGPILVCIGSDQSPVLSDYSGRPTFRDAVDSAFGETTSLSGAIILKIEDSHNIFKSGVDRKASGEFFPNPRANEKLAESDLDQLSKMDFNRWKYFFSLEKYEKEERHRGRKMSGNIKYGALGMNRIRLEIPSSVLIDCLAGKTDLDKEYSLKDMGSYYDCINNGWTVTSCSLKEGSIEAGEAPKVILELEHPLESVYWPIPENSLDAN
jgi:hypothetical protein